ncbi:Uncharacterised protein [Vibrio cholerae]|nr:Uncharacterised protein [Vibrio cholerae]
MQRTDFSFRIKDHNINIWHAIKCVRNSSAGITGCRRQNRDFSAVRDRRQRLGHKATTKIFKRERWPVEQFERVNALFHFGNRCGELKGGIHHSANFIRRQFIANQRR